MTRRFRLPSACALALVLVTALAACGDTATSAVVVIRSELPAGSVEQLRIEVTRGSDATQERRISVGPGGGADFPVRAPLVHRGGPLGPIRVAVVGTGTGGEVTGSADPFYFVVGDELTIPVTLTRDCVDVRCGEDERCVAGACRPVMLPDGGPQDGGPPDGGPLDAGIDMLPMCAPGCDCFLDEECRDPDGRCECKGGCDCELYCRPGETCGELKCKDADTTCAITAEDASEVTVNCDDAQCTSVNVRGVSNAVVKCKKDNGCCIVDCTGASNCFVDCEEEAYCRVDCTGASNCGFVDEGSCWADDNPLDCGGGVQVCGATSCPPDDACYPGVEPD